MSQDPFRLSSVTGRINDNPRLESLRRRVQQDPSSIAFAQLAEEYQRMMEQLGDSTLQRVATWKLEGYTDQEIAARLGCVTRTVERKLARIRTTWGREMRD